MNAAATLFDEVVRATGLVELIAPFTVSRLLVSAGVVPQELTRADLERALPTLEQGIAVFLDEEALSRAVGRLRALVQR